MGPLPKRSTRWTQTFGVMHMILDVARRGVRRSDLENAVDAVRLLEEKRELLAAAEMYPSPLPPGVSAWLAFLDWAVGQAKWIARS